MGRFVFDVPTPAALVATHTDARTSSLFRRSSADDGAANVATQTAPLPLPSTGDFFDSVEVQRAYLCGIEGVPFQTRVHRDANRLILTREVETSAKLYLPLWLPGIGFRTVSTCSLRPNDDGHAYELGIELGRGSATLLRSQIDLWRRGGLRLSTDFDRRVEQGIRCWIDALSSKDTGMRHHLAVHSVVLMQSAIDALGHQYAFQSVAYRTSQTKPLGTLLGCVVHPPGPADATQWSTLTKVVNCVGVRLSWGEVESDNGSLNFAPVDQAFDAAAQSNLRVIGGPLLDFRTRMMPHWLYLLEQDFDAVLAATVNYVEKVVARYRGRVSLWNAASGLNTPGPIPLSDEQAMRLTVAILQTVRRIDPETATVISFDQPLGENLSRSRDAISPMHFADAIARTGLGISGFGLDLHLGYRDGGTLPRSTVELGNAIDRWATLGMPLLVNLVVPGDTGVDAAAIAPSPPRVPPPGMAVGSTDADANQLRVAGAIIRTLLAKTSIHGIMWDGWDDRRPHVHSHGGLIDADGMPRRLMDYFIRLRKDEVV